MRITGLAFMIAALSVAGCSALSSSSKSLNSGVPTVDGFRQAGISPMNDPELSEFLIGKRITMKDVESGKVGTVRHAEEGKRLIQSHGMRFVTDFSIADGQYCAESVRSGETHCSQVYRTTEGVTYLCDPRHEGECRWRLIPSG
ncbi:MAG: hypothetical protein AAF713_00295 [Pseudomonadota bacterium]